MLAEIATHNNMIERDAAVAQIRPALALDVSPANHEEAFQTSALRPILKFQNALLLEHVRGYIKKFNPQFNALNQQSQKTWLKQTLVRDVGLKNDLVTFVVGLLTVEEYRFYHKHRSSIKKRITQMLISRLESQLERLL